MFASFPKTEEQKAVARMEKFWKDASHNDLYKEWFGGIARGLFYEGGLYDSSPMEDFLKNNFATAQMHRSINMGIVNVQNGTYHDFSEKNIT